MTDSCIVCETEPIDDSDWYRCESIMEVVCPWCVKDMHNIKEIMILKIVIVLVNLLN